MRSKKQQREFFKSKGEDQTEAVQIAKNKLNELFLWFFCGALFYWNSKIFCKNWYSAKRDIFWKMNFWCRKFKSDFCLWMIIELIGCDWWQGMENLV